MKPTLLLLLIGLIWVSVQGQGHGDAVGDSFAAQRDRVRALGRLTAAPPMMDAEGYAAEDGMRAIFYDGLPWKGNPTRVFAWLGIPKDRKGKVPGVVLVHGGGGTAFRNWVEMWNARGFAAISIAVEGQTDRKRPEKSWERHQWAGPSRRGQYHDSAEPLEDQWMYHAVADAILAHSLLRSLPEIDPDKIGIMGTSWGGIITSTVMGLDDRFAFAIPVYGCGNLAESENFYRRLKDNPHYIEVWDPMHYLGGAQMPALWFSWPQDKHFSMDRLAASYRAAPGPRMVTLIPNLGHGHGPPWSRPDSYRFAGQILKTGKPWCRLIKTWASGGQARALFDTGVELDRAVLVSTTDTGFTGNRTWVETDAVLAKGNGPNLWEATARLPQAVTAWFINVHSDDFTVSSEYQESPASVVDQ